VGEVRKEIAWPARKPLHWKKLRHLEKKLFAERISGTKARLVVACVHKPSLVDREKFQYRYRLYFYAVRYLLERVSWCIRDEHRAHPEGDGKVGVAFSNRGGMNYEEMRGYLKRLKTMSESGQDVRIEWDHLDPRDVRAFPAGRLHGLQVADAVAGALYNGLEPVKTRSRMPDYAQVLIPRFYRHRGSAWGNGIKLVPREAAGLVAEDAELSWFGTLE
jgi:hypothetical protein